VLLAVLVAACTSDSASRHASARQEREARVPVSTELTLAGTLTRPALSPGTRPPVVVLVGVSDPQDRDGAHPVLLGHSEGAVVAMRAASRDTTVSALVVMGAPSRTGRELARWQRAGLVATDAAEFPPADRGALLTRAEADAE